MKQFVSATALGEETAEKAFEPLFNGYIAVPDLKCGPCGLALGRYVRVPEPWAERHAKSHEGYIEDPVAFAKGFADMAAITMFPPVYGCWVTRNW